MSTADRLTDIHRKVFDDFTYIHDTVKWKKPEYWVSKQDIQATNGIGTTTSITCSRGHTYADPIDFLTRG